MTDGTELTLQHLDSERLATTFSPSCRVALLALHSSPLDQPGSGDSGGMNVYISEVAVELARRHRVYTDVFTRRTSSREPEVREIVRGVRVFSIKAGPAKPLAKERLPRYVGRFVDAVEARAVLDGPYDLIHAHYWLSGVAGALLKERWGIPLVVSFHTLARMKDIAGSGEDPEPAFRKRGEARVIRAADRIAAGSEIERAQLMELYGSAADRVVVVPPGVDLDVFHPNHRAEARQRFGLGNRPTILFVGRLQPLKGAHVALGALARLKRMVPDAQLVVVGGDSPRGSRGERMRLALRARRLGISRRVRFLEPLPHSELATLYRAADAVVIPSASETFGLVALEASACGTPVVATAVGGLRRLVRDGQTGYLVARRDPKLFAAALSRVLADSEARDRLGANAVELAAQFPWSRTAEGLLRTYGSVMGCPSRRGALVGAG